MPFFVLLSDPKERLTWEDYFKHPFFTKRQMLKSDVKENPKPNDNPKPNEIRMVLRIGNLDLSKKNYRA